MGTWLWDRSVRTKLIFFGAVGFVAVVAVGVLAVRAMSDAKDASSELERLSELIRTSVETDMAHDAFRGDVLRVMLAPNAGEEAEARADVAASGEALRSGVTRFSEPDVPANARTAAEAAIPAVDEYVDLGRRIAAAARPGAPPPAEYAQFPAAFTQVEEELPHVGDALGEAEHVAAESIGQQRSSTIRLVLVLVVACLALMLAVGRLVMSSILVPLARVREVTRGLADGDLTRSTGLTSGDEFGEMGRGLDASVARLREAMRGLGSTADALGDAAGELAGVGGDLSAGAADASTKAGAASAAASRVDHGIQAVMTGAEEMSASVAEIADNAGRAAQVAKESVRAADEVTAEIAGLRAAGDEIGGVVALITSIAEQTNLLALNATIEAARAGEAGTGFAVVASEVKDLAQETARATSDITERINAIQGGTASAAAAVEHIRSVIRQINEFNVTIASAVEEQSATTNTMTHAITDTARGSAEVSSVVGVVAQVAESTSGSATVSQHASQQVARQADELRSLLAAFRF